MTNQEKQLNEKPEENIDDLIAGLEIACELFDRIQERKAVIEAQRIVREAN